MRASTPMQAAGWPVTRARLSGLRAGPIKFSPGPIIALYTDGLVETRTRSFDQGILALRSVLPCGPCQLDTACDRLISALAERFEDDVTVVLVRIPETGTRPPDLP
jgi:serine/threonine protein phosphatase PrpC